MKCFSSPRYFAPLPAGHPFPMDKFPASAAEISSRGLGMVVDPGEVADRELLRVHTPEYVDSIRRGEYNELTKQRLGLPWSPELAMRSRCATAGTLKATYSALADGLAANLAGGTHHAFPDRGEGYCVFNDVAVAVRALQAEDASFCCMVVDLDAHQGNATHFIFDGDGRVFTYSLHVGPNYPSRKHAGSMDVELPRYAPAGMFFERLEATLPETVERAEPDVAFYIAGVDVHAEDRFGQMMLSTADMRRREEYTLNLLRGWQIPTVVVYGGGYHKTPGMTAKLHVQTIEVASERFLRERGLSRVG